MKSTTVWQLLLNIREKMSALRRPVKHCAFSVTDPGNFFVDAPPHGQGPWVRVIFDATEPLSTDAEDTVFQVFDLLDYRLKQNGHLPEHQLDFLHNYLPYCFLPHFAFLRGRTITVAHFAQSLDGRIATQQGHSRWISNDANLEHAHRMRALCDGILIGKNTLYQDHPQLTVRRVKGPNPVRIVIGSQIENCSSLVMASHDPIIVIQKEVTDLADELVQQVVYPCEDHYIPREVVLQKLFENGITSVLIEGGAKTTSLFLQDGLLDILQLHLAPMLLGSGWSSFQLPEIAKIDHAVVFRSFFFQRMANTFMFVGQVEADPEDSNF